MFQLPNLMVKTPPAEVANWVASPCLGSVGGASCVGRAKGEDDGMGMLEGWLAGHWLGRPELAAADRRAEWKGARETEVGVSRRFKNYGRTGHSEYSANRKDEEEFFKKNLTTRHS